jgi:hypothetical protein
MRRTARYVGKAKTKAQKKGVAIAAMMVVEMASSKSAYPSVLLAAAAGGS